MKKCINLTNSTFYLYVLYNKLAQNTKQFRKLVLENSLLSFISYSVEKAFYGLRPWVFGLLNIFPPLVPASHFHTYRPKLLLAHGGNDILKNVYLNVTLIVLPKLLSL